MHDVSKAKVMQWWKMLEAMRGQKTQAEQSRKLQTLCEDERDRLCEDTLKH
jgi:hypothetical protein